MHATNQNQLSAIQVCANAFAVPVSVCAAGISGVGQFWLAALLTRVAESLHTLQI